MSPLEATIKADLRVNEAAQLVEAIAHSINDLHEPERVINALAELNLEGTKFLLTQDPAGDNDGPVIIEATEVWQARSARAALASSNGTCPRRDGSSSSTMQPTDDPSLRH